jgi:hypothetical protein
MDKQSAAKESRTSSVNAMANIREQGGNDRGGKTGSDIFRDVAFPIQSEHTNLRTRSGCVAIAAKVRELWFRQVQRPWTSPRKR